MSHQMGDTRNEPNPAPVPEDIVFALSLEVRPINGKLCGTSLSGTLHCKGRLCLFILSDRSSAVIHRVLILKHGPYS